MNALRGKALTPEQADRDLGNSFKSVRDTVTHLYAAEWAWYSRWQGTSPTAPLPFDQFPDVATLRAVWTDHEAKMRTYLESLGDEGITRVFNYRTLAGLVFWQMLQHVVNHGSYHRGQVTTLLRQLGAPPAKSMDLVAFYRERATEARR